MIRFRVQFGINLHEWVFQKAELHEPLRRVQSFQLFEKLTKILVIAVYMRSLAYNFLNVFLQIIIQNYDV